MRVLTVKSLFSDVPLNLFTISAQSLHHGESQKNPPKGESQTMPEIDNKHAVQIVLIAANAAHLFHIWDPSARGGVGRR